MGRKLHRADGTRRAPVAFMVGLLYMEHGFAKILDFSHQSTHVPYAPFTLNPGLQELLEFVGGLLLVLGSFTRTITSVLAGNMAVAYFMLHAPRGFFPLLNGGELAVVYCFVFLYLAGQLLARHRPRHRHQQITADPANQPLDFAFVVALAGPTISVGKTRNATAAR
jgi:putative oxidoreductase